MAAPFSCASRCVLCVSGVGCVFFVWLGLGMALAFVFGLELGLGRCAFLRGLGLASVPGKCGPCK